MQNEHVEHTELRGWRIKLCVFAVRFGTGTEGSFTPQLTNCSKLTNRRGFVITRAETTSVAVNSLGLRGDGVQAVDKTACTPSWMIKHKYATENHVKLIYLKSKDLYFC